MTLELEPCTVTYQTTRQTVLTPAEDDPRKAPFLSYPSGCFITLTPKIVTEGSASLTFLGVPTEYFMSRTDFNSLRLMPPREGA